MTITKHIAIAALATLATITAASAQQAAPARPAPAAQTTPAPTPAPQAGNIGGGGAIGNGMAASAQEARNAAATKLSARQQGCTSKGAAYKWTPPHVVGDANPKGGFYTTNYNGGCKLISMREGLASGLITINKR